MPENRTRRAIGLKLGQLIAGFAFAFAAIAVTDTFTTDQAAPVLIVLGVTSTVAAVVGAAAAYREKRCRRG
jgi:hypothetical protein